MPAPREEAVDLVGDPGRGEDERGRPAVAVVGPDDEDDEDGDQPQPQDRERVRHLRQRARDGARGHIGEDSPRRAAPRVRQRPLPRLPARSQGPHRGRRLLGLAGADARGGSPADARARPGVLRPGLPGDAQGRLHGGRGVPLPRGSPRVGQPPTRPRRRAWSSCSSTSPTRAVGSSAFGRRRSPRIWTSSSSCAPPASASASPPTLCARAPRTGSRSWARTPRARGCRCTCTPTSNRARSRSASPSTASGRSSCSRARAASASTRPSCTRRTRTVHELDLLADAGARICACPTTEANLGDGFLPVERVRTRGIALCIGSDSNVRIDPLEELRELEGIARRQSGRRNVIPLDDAAAHRPRRGRTLARARLVAGRRGRPRAPLARRSRGRRRRRRPRVRSLSRRVRLTMEWMPREGRSPPRQSYRPPRDADCGSVVQPGPKRAGEWGCATAAREGASGRRAAGRPSPLSFT